MKINLSDLFEFDKLIPPIDQETLIDQLIKDTYPKRDTLPIHHTRTYFLEPYGNVTIKLRHSLFLIDPLLKDPSFNYHITMLTNRLYHDYLLQAAHNFQPQAEETDEARIWPKFHTFSNQYFIFTRLGYIFDHPDHAPHEAPYQLTFLQPEEAEQYAYITPLATKLNQQLLTANSHLERLYFLHKALQKISPAHLDQFKLALNTLNMSILDPFTSVNEAKLYFELLLKYTLQTVRGMESTRLLLYKCIAQLNPAFTSTSKTEYVNALEYQIEQLNQQNQPTNFHAWCTWQQQQNKRYTETAIIHGTLEWLLERFALKTLNPFYPVAPLQDRERIYDCIKILCGPHQDVGKLSAIIDLLQHLTPYDIASLHGKLKIPTHENLFTTIMNEITKPSSLAP